jgi:ankyrin repeat domain-containing protein 50
MFAYDDDVAVACVYFDHKQDYQHVAILRNILKQLIQHRESQISDEVHQLHKKFAKKDRQPPLSEISETLKHEVGHFSKVFVVFDALDECGNSTNTRKTILQELAELQPKLRLMITGRPFAETHVSIFPKYETLEIKTKDSDVEKFVVGEIEMDDTLRKYASGENELGRLIVETVVKKSHGM